MSISSAIHSARTGLDATSVRADIVANNVANASTPGYVRRSVSLAETIINGTTGGVSVRGIVRSEDAGLIADRRAVSSDLAQADLLSSVWQSLSAQVGDSVEDQGLFSRMSAFEGALSSAALSPESNSHALSLLSSAQSLIAEFQSLSSEAIDIRAEADGEIAVAVDKLNDTLGRIHELNTKISASDRTSNHAASLFDERQRLVDSVAQYLPIEAVPRENGKIDVMTKEGVFLIAGTSVETIEFSRASAFGPDQTIAGGQLSGLMVGDIDITPGANSFAAVSSGVLGGLFQIRDQDMPQFSAQLDAIAEDLVTRLSDDSIDPTKPMGDYGLFVDPDPAAGAGLAARLQINASVDPGQGGEIWRLRDGVGAAAEGEPGNNTILNAMLNAVVSVAPINASGLQGQFSAAELTANFSSITGQNRINQESVLAATRVQHDALVEAEQAENGVDVDQQMQELLFIEQSYAANARVIEVASQLMNILMEL